MLRLLLTRKTFSQRKRASLIYSDYGDSRQKELRIHGPAEGNERWTVRSDQSSPPLGLFPRRPWYPTLFQWPSSSFRASASFIEGNTAIARDRRPPQQHRWCSSFAAAFSWASLGFLCDATSTLSLSHAHTRGSEVLMRQTRDDGVENGIDSLWNASFLT